MAAVARGSGVGLLASAKIDRLGLLSLVGDWRHSASFVSAIAKRLGRTLTAGTPVISFAGFDGNGHWGVLFCVAHKIGKVVDSGNWQADWSPNTTASS